MNKRTSQLKKLDTKYLEGIHLSGIVSPDTPAAYSEAMLLVLRGDAKKQVRVKAPHTKKGYYYRMQEVSDKPPPQTRMRKPRSSKASRSPSAATIAGAVVAGVVASAAVGAAAGAGIALWQSQEGTRKQVAAAQQQADQRVQREVDRAKQEVETKYSQQAEESKQEAETRLQSEVAKAKQETEERFGAQVEEVRKQATADVEAVQQRSQAEIDRISQEWEGRIQAGIESGTAEERQRLTQQTQVVQERAKALERTYKERQKALEKSLTDRTSVLEREHQQRIAQLDRQVRQNELDHGNRLRELEENTRLELEERTVQIENRVNSEKITEIAKAREEASRAAIEQIRQEQQKAEYKRLAGRVNPGDLIATPETGIALAASVDRNLKLSTIPPESLKQRFNDAVGRLVEKRQAEALESFLPDLKRRVQDVRSMTTREPKRKWEAIEHTLIQQTNRENGLDAALSDIKAEYRKKHREELDRFLAKAEGRGGFDSDLIEEFDKKLTKLNASMQKSIGKAIDQVREDTPLDKSFLGRPRTDGFKIVRVKGTPERKPYERKIRTNPVAKAVQGTRRRVRQVVETGRGGELDIKPALEEVVTAVAGAAAPKSISPLAAGAARFGMRSWRLSYKEVSESGIQGLFSGFKKLSKEEKQKLYSDSITQVASTAASHVAGDLVEGISPDLSTPVGVDVDLGKTASGTTASKTIKSIAQKVSRKILKSDSYWTAFQDFLNG